MEIKVLSADDLIPDPDDPNEFMFEIEVDGKPRLVHSSEVDWIDP